MSMDREDFESDEAWKNYLDQQMTQKFSAADFANARFAEHPDGDFAARLYPEHIDPWLGDDDCAYTDQVLADTGWVPVPTKPTITDSEVGAIADHKTDDWLDGFMAGYEKAGGTILEETTHERVARLVNEIVDGHGIVPVGEKVADRLISVGLVKGN